MQCRFKMNKPYSANGSLVVSGDFEKEDGERFHIYYKIPERFQSYVSARPETFILAFIFKAMEEGLDLVVDEPVFQSFLRNIEEFQAAWHLWLPKKYKPVEIVAVSEENDEGVSRNGATVSAISGGVDGLHTLYDHKKNPDKKRPFNLQACLFVHGFDIPLKDKESFAALYSRLNEICRDAGVELIPLETNIKHLWLGHWPDYHGAAIISCFYLLMNKFSTALIGSSHPYDQMIFPLGSNPLTDRLLSCNRLYIAHEGSGASRTQKIIDISKWEAGFKNLHVCTKLKDENCGKCEKCTRTMLNFKAAGIDPAPAFKNANLTSSQIRNVVAVNQGKLEELRSVYNYAKERRVNDDWVGDLKHAITKNSIKLYFKNKIYRGKMPDQWIKKLASKI